MDCGGKDESGKGGMHRCRSRAAAALPDNGNQKSIRHITHSALGFSIKTNTSARKIALKAPDLSQSETQNSVQMLNDFPVTYN